jgi:type III secretion protein O
MDVVKDLLRIKKFREQKAEVALSKARQTLASAVDALVKSRQALADNIKRNERRERALYDDLFSRLVIKAEIDAVGVEIEGMRQEIKRAEEVVEKKKVVRDDAEKKLEAARQHHHAAMRAREKFTELADLAKLENKALAEKAEDVEMEEVRTRAPETATVAGEYDLAGADDDRNADDVSWADFEGEMA